MTATTPFLDAARAYLDAGWGGILPLPAQAKANPPQGFTGRGGAWPTETQIERWLTGEAFDLSGTSAGNIALRLPLDVVGVDLDLYKDPGAREILESRTGPLPPTWCSTSRVDGSGIRLYRCQPPPAGKKWPGAPIAAVEIIQYHHRYVVVWPSVHPEGRTYLWVDEASGEIADHPPAWDDLTELPWAAAQALLVDDDTGTERPPVAFTLTTGDASHAVRRKLLEGHLACQGAAGSRHDTVLQAVCALVRLAERGEPGVDRALDELGATFIAAVAPDRPGGARAATREFNDMIRGAERIVAGTVGRIPTRDERMAERDVGWLGAAERPATIPAAMPAPNGQQPATEPELTGWEPVDLAAVLASDYEPPTPTVLTRADGAGMFYAGRVNALNGESGSGKSWIALLAGAQQLGAGRAVIYVDHEDHHSSVTGRLRSLGVTDDVMVDRFLYVAPERPASEDALLLLEHLITTRDVGLVVIDSVGEDMALHALKQNDDDEVARWFRRFARRLARPGPAVVLIDHVPKENDATKLFAIGSQRKRAAIDGVAWRVDLAVAFSATKRGKIRLTVAKDRNGVYPQGSITDADVRPRDGTLEVVLRAQQVAVVVVDGVETTERVAFRPTGLMERISVLLEDGKARKGVDIEQLIKGKNDYIRIALKVLGDEGFVTMHKGERNASWYSSTKPYRETSELIDEPVDNPVRPSSPQFAPVRPGASGGGPGSSPLAPLPRRGANCPPGRTESDSHDLGAGRTEPPPDDLRELLG